MATLKLMTLSCTKNPELTKPYLSTELKNSLFEIWKWQKKQPHHEKYDKEVHLVEGDIGLYLKYTNHRVVLFVIIVKDN